MDNAWAAHPHIFEGNEMGNKEFTWSGLKASCRCIGNFQRRFLKAETKKVS